VNAGGGTMTVEVTYCIVTKNPGGGIACTVLSALGASTKNFKVDHCTYPVSAGAVGVSIGETYGGYSGMCTSVRSNVAFSASTAGGVVSNGGSPVDNYVVVADYNVGWDTVGDQALADNYGPADAKFQSTPGPNDVNVNPLLVDEDWDLAAYDAAAGGAGTVANLLAEIVKMNDSDFDSAYVVQTVLESFFAKYSVQEPTLENAGHDSITIGAAPFVAAGTDDFGAEAFIVGNPAVRSF
jgi:hypothetical protein